MIFKFSFYIITSFLLLNINPTSAAIRTENKVTDYSGIEYDTKFEARRIVSLLPHITETLIDLGLQDLVIASPDQTLLSIENKKKVFNLGPYHLVSVESIAALKPDLVIASLDGNDPSVVKKLRQIGLKVFVLSSHSISEICKSMEFLTVITHSENNPKWKHFQNQFIKEFELLKKTSSQGPYPSTIKSKIRIFFQLGVSPFITISNRTFIGELFSIAGFENVFAISSQLYPQVSAESVISKNPDLILIAPMTDKDLINSADTIGSISYWKKFSTLKAAQTNHIVILEKDIFTKPGFNLSVALEKLSQIKKNML